MRLRHLLPVATCLLLSAGCAPDTSVDELEQNASEEGAASVDTVYIVTRPDFRKCVSPMCGGVYVKAVNKTKTTCLDGTKQVECYVGEIDFSAIGLSEDERYEARAKAGEGKLLLSGKLSLLQGDIAKLETFKAFEGVSGHTPNGTFYVVEPSGITCVTAPCPSFHAKKINSTLVKQITDLDLAALGLEQAQIDQAMSTVFEKNLIVVGKIKSVAMPFGTAKKLLASEIYETLEPKPAQTLCMSNEACGAGETCDTSQCLSNCPPDMVCPAVCWGACVPAALECPGGGEICASLCGGQGIEIPEGCPIPSCNCPVPPPEPQPGSCFASCGGQSPDQVCYCDDLCSQYGDCCNDYAAMCQ